MIQVADPLGPDDGWYAQRLLVTAEAARVALRAAHGDAYDTLAEPWRLHLRRLAPLRRGGCVAVAIDTGHRLFRRGEREALFLVLAALLDVLEGEVMDSPGGGAVP